MNNNKNIFIHLLQNKLFKDQYNNMLFPNIDWFESKNKPTKQERKNKYNKKLLHKELQKYMKHKYELKYKYGREFEKIQANFKGQLQKHQIQITEYSYPNEFINKYIEKIYNLLKQFKDDQRRSQGITFQINLFFVIEHTNTKSKEYVWRKCKAISKIQINKDDTINIIKECANKLTNDIEDLQQKGSDIRYIKSKIIEVIEFPYNPLRGSLYLDLHKSIKNKKCCINVKNNDNQCFKWSVLSALHPTLKDPQRVLKYKQFENELNFNNLEFPIKIDDIPKFEKLNNISINVFSYYIDENNEPIKFVYYLTKNNFDKHVNLLLIESVQENEIKYHYCWIKNLSGFLTNSNGHKRIFCLRCLQGFNNQTKLNEHKLYCDNFDYIKTTYPKNDGIQNIMKFNKLQNCQKIPYKIYCDFESTLNKPNEEFNNDQQDKNTKILSFHNLSGYCIVVVNSITNESKVYYYSDPNLISNEIFQKFITTIFEIKKEIEQAYLNKNAKKIIMTQDDENNFIFSENCYLCKKIFGEKIIKKNNEIILYKVRDHCHFSGKYRGAACQLCNLKYRIQKNIPIIFHNLRGYDSHLIFDNIGEFLKNRDDIILTAIPTNIEKYLSFTIATRPLNKEDRYKMIKLRFIDSYQFLSSSIDDLAKNLSNDKKILTIKHLKHFNINESNIHLIMKKGVFPYSWFDDKNKLNNTELPEKKYFYDDLIEENISDDKYNHALNVWKSLNIKTFKEYHDIYMMTDTLLLADIFNEFIEVCLNNYKVDPAYYLSSPGMSLDAYLKFSNVEIELINEDNSNMFLFFEKQIRGGVSTIFKRHSKANNKYMKDYNPKEPSKYIIYLDANNLYGWAMSQKLPLKDFKNINLNEWNESRIKEYDFNRDIGITFDVDLEYPKELHDLHDYPFAPENIFIENENLSSFQNSIIENLQLKRTKTNKLIPNLRNKTNYIVHGKLLQFYLNHGMKIIKINRGIQYYQSNFMESYINENTKRRTLAKNDFEKDFFKLLNNSIYGKTLENLRKHMDVILMTDDEYKKFEKINSKNMINDVLLYNGLTAVKKRKIEVFLNRPIQIGASILDLSKLLMYDFYYDHLKNKYGDKCKILMTDTDSIIAEIETDDLYNDMLLNKKYYDLSEMKIKQFQNNENKKVIGKFKDETNGIPIKEFVGLKSKCYSYLLDDNNKNIKKCKGTKKYKVKNELTHQIYYDTLMGLNNGSIKLKQNGIRSLNHKLSTNTQEKICLSIMDDKSYLIDNFNARPHFHFKNT